MVLLSGIIYSNFFKPFFFLIVKEFHTLFSSSLCQSWSWQNLDCSCWPASSTMFVVWKSTFKLLIVVKMTVKWKISVIPHLFSCPVNVLLKLPCFLLCIFLYFFELKPSFLICIFYFCEYFSETTIFSVLVLAAPNFSLICKLSR